MNAPLPIAPPPAEAASEFQGPDLAAQAQREPDTAMEALGVLLVYAVVTGVALVAILFALYG